jgi:GNAT superfamily N-acetyltransferase
MEHKSSEVEIENQDIRTITISGVELIDRIYKGETLPQDNRFRDINKGGVFEYLRLNELVRDPNPTFFSILELNGKIIGIAGLMENPNDKKNFWFTSISIDPKYQGKGYSRKLIDEVFNFSEKHADSIKLSTYSPMGTERIKRYIEEKRKKCTIKVIDPRHLF